ncbi:MAG: hypothetical protein E7208_03675 [Clostridium butyricum]|nr:hypothetical protein [Clostridium butyricum]
MVTDIAILYTITKELKDNFPTFKILVDGNKSEIKKDTFSIQVRPLNSDTYKRYSKELFNITIDYIKDKDLNQEEKLNMKTKLNKIFGMGIKIDKTYIVFQNKSWNMDGVFSLSFTINFINSLDELPLEDKYTSLMEELKLEMMKGER